MTPTLAAFCVVGAASVGALIDVKNDLRIMDTRATAAPKRNM